MDKKVLVVDDETATRTVIGRVLRRDGYDVTEVSSGEEALERFRLGPYPIVLTDIMMDEMTGLELLEEVRLLDENTLVVLMTSQASLETATSALRSGAYDFLVKPFDDVEVVSAVVDRANEKHRLLNQNLDLMDSLKKNAEELERLNRSLQEMADHDGLTGLYNHRYFRAALEKELARAERHDRRFSILFMDLDDFKQYNDTHGHLAGDDLLRELARILSSRARMTTVLARYGGEEFVALIPETDKIGARQYAEAIRQQVETFDRCCEDSLGGVTISIGVASYPEDGTDSQSLLTRADGALYQAKQDGKNAVRG